MRRLPVFFLLDVSESMLGDGLVEMQDALGQVVSTLRRDPHVLESAFLSVSVFAGRAMTLVPLTEIASFRMPELPVGGGTSLGTALDHLMRQIDHEVVRTTPERKGDWRPLIFLLTDGHPTDRPDDAINRWNRGFRARTSLVCVSIGGRADHRVLRRLSDDVIIFLDSAPDAFGRFATWVSQSIESQSRSVAAGRVDEVNLAKFDRDLITPIEAYANSEPAWGVDDRFAVFVGKCSRDRQPYLVKYERGRADDPDLSAEVQELLRHRPYVLSLALPISNTYFDLTEGGAAGAIKSDMLLGQPNCPRCQAPYGMALCACGGIHCVTGEGQHACPWCGKIGIYESSDGGGFDINRGQG